MTTPKYVKQMLFQEKILLKNALTTVLALLSIGSYSSEAKYLVVGIRSDFSQVKKNSAAQEKLYCGQIVEKPIS